MAFHEKMACPSCCLIQNIEAKQSAKGEPMSAAAGRHDGILSCGNIATHSREDSAILWPAPGCGSFHFA